MTKNKFAKILVPALLSLSLSFMGLPEASEAPEAFKESQPLRTLVTEYHVITSVENNHVLGENVTGKGEGINFIMRDLLLVSDSKKAFKVGDTIAISWTLENYQADEWDSLYSVDLLGGASNESR